jgi:GNAT superfamily N-acetyltransferase
MSPADHRTALWQVDGTRAVLLTLDDAPSLQQFFDENPDYFLTVSGQVASADAAHKQLAGDVPEEFSYTQQLAIGFIDQDAHLIGVADVVSDLLSAGVWHIGLFMVAARRRGQGLGTTLYQALEAWIEAAGARWIRLGVVIGNSMAE